MAAPGSGFIVKATCEGFSNMQSMGLRDGYEHLVVDLADAFDLIPASVNLFSLHNGTKLMVHLGSQGDLDVVLAEAMEWGSHVLTVQVSGIPARRALDGIGCMAVFAATVSQLAYLYWMVTESQATFSQELQIWSILIFTVLVNFAGYAYLLDEETDKNHPFRLWIKPFFRRLLMLVISPFSGDVLPLVGCKSCGLDAPLRAATRDGVVKWGILLLLLQDCGILRLLYSMHFAPGEGEELHPLTTIPMVALYVTAFSVSLNFPRRLSHFLLGTCDAAFREKEELADDAKISMFAAQKTAAKDASQKNAAPVSKRSQSPNGSPKPAAPSGPKPPPYGAATQKLLPSQRAQCAAVVGKGSPPPGKKGKNGKAMV